MIGASPVAQKVKNLPAVQETGVRSLGWEDPLEEEEMATHSIILAWRIPWGGWQATVCGSQRAGHDWAIKHTCMDSNEGSRCLDIYSSASVVTSGRQTQLYLWEWQREPGPQHHFCFSSSFLAHASVIMASTPGKYLGLLGFYSLFFFKLQALSLTCNLILSLGMNQMCRRVSL